MSCYEARATGAPKTYANGPSKMPYTKYQDYVATLYKDLKFDDKWTERKWPSKRIQQAPRWCSVDLRDGNQALVNPMNHDKKLRFFNHLVKLGYKEIEVGFPAASQTDFDFCRHIVENNLVPDDVFVQVLCQCRESLIKTTAEALVGAKNVILHIYNSTSELQRRVVFEKDQAGIKALAVEGANLIKKYADELLVPKGTNVRYEYSPESYTGTELPYVVEVCDAIVDILAPDPGQQLIINLPATVEMAGPNVYADSIEWMAAHFKDRSKVILSLHPHNDRGCGIAAAELGVQAGADRVEGCLFGNGERTGNVCLVALGMNLFTQGIDPEIDFSNMQESIDVAEYCNELKVPERHPWAGSLVYTAFSGSHQDAIKKGMSKMTAESKYWEVPYLPVDPSHIGRSYEAVIRVNSQSGKGGIAFILEEDYGIPLPKDCQIEFSPVIQAITDKTSQEISPAMIYKAFSTHYLEQEGGYKLLDFEISSKLTALAELELRGITGLPKDMQVELVAKCKPLKDRQDCYKTFRDAFVDVRSPLELIAFEVTGTDDVSIKASVAQNGKQTEINGKGNGPIDAYMNSLNSLYGGDLKLQMYSERDINAGAGATAEAVCFISISHKDGPRAFGAGINANTTRAALLAVTAAANRALSAENGVASQNEPLESIVSISAKVHLAGETKSILGSGNGPVAAFISGMRTYYEDAKDMHLQKYSQVARISAGSSNRKGSSAEAICAISLSMRGKTRYGVGIDANTNHASAKAVLSAMTLISWSFCEELH